MSTKNLLKQDTWMKDESHLGLESVDLRKSLSRKEGRIESQIAKDVGQAQEMAKVDLAQELDLLLLLHKISLRLRIGV